MAARIRAMARTISLLSDREMLLKHAASLEPEAAQIEAAATPTPTSQPVVHEQQQAQQQKDED